MSTPVIESIAVDIAAVIAAITTDNGFNQDLTAQRPRRQDFSDVTPEDLLCLIVQNNASAEGGAVGCATWKETFEICVFVIDSDDATDSIDTRRNAVAADITKKLNEDITRGGYAYDTQIIDRAMFNDGEGLSGVVVTVEVSYRTLLNDPYTKT